MSLRAEVCKEIEMYERKIKELNGREDDNGNLSDWDKDSLNCCNGRLSGLYWVLTKIE